MGTRGFQNGEIVYYFDYDLLEAVKARVKTQGDYSCFYRVAPILNKDGVEDEEVIKDEYTLFTSEQALWAHIIAETEVKRSYAAKEYNRAKATLIRTNKIIREARKALAKLAEEDNRSIPYLPGEVTEETKRTDNELTDNS